MEIGFFGGTFNPVHKGHIKLASYLRTQYDIPEIWLSLSPQNPLKNATHPGATDAQRFEMLKLACESIDGLRAWDGELTLPRPSYTFNVLQQIKENGHDPILIIGADNWINFNKWYNHERIISDFKIIVYPRPGYDIKHQADLKNVIFALDAPQTDISSTEIRNHINDNLRNLTPEVADYIIKNNLYGY